MEKRKVIGWSNNSLFKEADREYDQSYYDALFADIDAHGYDFSGEQMTLVPVFDDYRFMDFSSRGWAKIMCNDDEDYLEYYSSAMFDGEQVLPQEGCYEKTACSVEVSEEEFDLIMKEVVCSDSLYSAYLYLLDEDEKNIYWPGERFEVGCSTKADSPIVLSLNNVVPLEDENDLKELIEKVENITFGRKASVVCSPTLVETIGKRPCVVLVLA